MLIVEVEGLTKIYDGRNVLNNISFSVEKGEVFGLLGPSGAGKTTIINILIGLVMKDSGNVTVLNCSPDCYNDKIYSSFGVLLDNDGLYERLSCFDNLELFGRIYRIPHRKKTIDDLLLQVGLIDAKSKKVSELSKGMRQRLAFARSILHCPSIVFLDEPTSGLDPTSSLQIHTLIMQLCNAGTTVFLTTHNMQEAQQICNHIVLLNGGYIIESGTPDGICLRHNEGKKVEIELVDGRKMAVSFDKLTDAISTIGDSNLINKIHSNEPTLEEIFIKLTGRELV